MFPHPNSNLDKDPIPDKATVSLRFYEMQTEERKGYTYAIAKDAKNQYLFCSQDHDNYGDQIMLTPRYK